MDNINLLDQEVSEQSTFNELHFVSDSTLADVGGGIAIVNAY